MNRINYLAFFLLAIVMITTSCNDDKEDRPSGIANQSWKEGEVLTFSTEKDLTLRFTTYGKWVATVAGGADWCKLSQTSGNKGSHSFMVSANGATTKDRTATITVNAEGSRPSSFKVTQKAGSLPEDTGDAIVNREVNKYLDEMYLWNEEYKSLKKNFSQGYEDFFYNNLYGMTTNTLDKKADGNGNYHLFSYIVKKKTIGTTRAATQIERELEYSFGFTGMIAVEISNTQIVLCPQGIYPDSPASENGINRGAFLYKMNGKDITKSNMNQVFMQLMYPESSVAATLTEIETDENGNFKYDESGNLCTRESALSARAMYKNPILHHEVITSNNGHKTGYLVYENFDAGFDDVLFDVFKEFKREGIQDLVLDLRYNGGGHVTTANLIASCLAGSNCRDKVFAKYRYNEERMKKYSNSRLEENFSYGWYANLKTSLTAAALGLNRLYCLVGSGTASASELVINALRGIGIDVVLIGKRTTGKNVGMEPKEITVEKDTYEVVPITFQTYNAKGFGEYENGFLPDIELDETDADGDGYFNTYFHFGHPDEPLLARAIREITGEQPIGTRSLMRAPANGKAFALPTVQRPGHYGMIKTSELPAENALTGIAIQ